MSSQPKYFIVDVDYLYYKNFLKNKGKKWNTPH